MKKIARKIISFGLVSVMVLATSATAFANEEALTHEKQPKVVIENTDLSVPDYIIQDIVNRNPNAEQINITEYKKIDVNNSNLANQRMASSSDVYYTNVEKNVTDSDILAKTEFVISVAKGEVMQLGSAWSASLNCSVSGVLDASTLGIETSITKSYSATRTFKEPEESSSSNSRSFYVDFFNDEGNYTATCHDPFPGWYITYPVSGSYTEPTEYAAYSVDSFVSK